MCFPRKVWMKQTIGHVLQLKQDNNDVVSVESLQCEAWAMVGTERWGQAVQVVSAWNASWANQVSRQSLTFNLLAVSFPAANSCLFKWSPAQPPQPRRSIAKLHLIFHKWESREPSFYCDLCAHYLFDKPGCNSRSLNLKTSPESKHNLT